MIYEHNIDSVSELISMANTNIISSDKLNRSTIVYTKFQKDKCLGCGRCYISCRDAGHQAIEFDFKTRVYRYRRFKIKN